MENKINIAEILKGCPKGMALYSPLCEKCIFDRLNFGTIICKKQNTQEITFTSEGYYMLPVFNDCECVLFPSKENRDWSKFQIPFEDGDIVFSGINLISIFKEPIAGIGGRAGRLHSYVSLVNNNKLDVNGNFWTLENIRYATEEEKQRLFDAIKANGYKWNAETKTLEKLSKFKVGDRIILKDNPHNIPSIRIKAVTKSQYILENEGFFYIDSTDEKYVLEDKFDINTLKPFESKVLVRDSKKFSWRPALYGGVDYQSLCPFITVGGMMYKCMIPYEGNEHLLGTTNDCDEFYKSWK